MISRNSKYSAPSGISSRSTDVNPSIAVTKVLFEAAAAPPTLDQALNMVARHGQIVLVAIAWEPVSVLPANWMAREVKLQASFGSRPENWQTSLNLIQSGKVNMAPMLSEAGFIPIEAIQGAFEELIKPTTQLQVVVKP